MQFLNFRWELNVHLSTCQCDKMRPLDVQETSNKHIIASSEVTVEVWEGEGHSKDEEKLTALQRRHSSKMLGHQTAA
eukprot:5924242-Pyramimonas_sp.AAC.1